MRPFFVHGEMVRRAVAIHVLEPEDIAAVKGSTLKPPELLRALQEGGYLRAPVVEALGRLVELRPVTISGNMTANTKRPSAGGTVERTGESQLNVGGTLATDDESPTGLNVGGTLQTEEETTRALNVGARTLETEDAPTGALHLNAQTGTTDEDSDGAPSKLNVKGGTLASDLDTTDTEGPKANVKRSTVESYEGSKPNRLNVKTGTQDSTKSGTVSPDAETKLKTRGTIAGYTKAGTLAPNAGTKLNTGGTLGGTMGGTVAPDDGPGINSGGTAAGGLNVSGDTLEAEERGGTLIAEDPFPALQKAEEWDGLVDLSSLDPPRRQILEGAAFGRIAIRLGYVTWEQLSKAYSTPGVRVEDYLTQRGFVDPTKAMEIFELCQTKRAVCWNCFALLPSAESNCTSCGKRQVAITLTAAAKKQRGIEGFPDEGGTFGDYELLKRVAEGGMGVVYRARQLKLNRVVALKVMRGGNMASRARRRRFLQEAEAVAALKHPSIVPVFEIDEAAGYPFYTMDFVEGSSLDQYVIQNKPDQKQIAELLRKLADAVSHFHLHGIIHRDLKPDNILVGSDALPKIIDFGIAKKLGEDKKGQTLEGSVLGTPHYMSPEQAAGRVSEVDVRTDVYALGTILYELLTGAPPWKDLPQAALVVAIQEQDPPAIRSKRPDIDVDLDAIVQKAMAKERERRYQSALELEQDIDRYLKNMPIVARPASIVYRLKKAVIRRLPQVVAASVVLLMFAAVATYGQVQKMRFRARMDSELATARDPALKLEQRRDHALGVTKEDPENGEAKALLGQIDTEINQAKVVEERTRQVRLDKEKADREKAEAELVAQKANEALNIQKELERKAKEKEEQDRKDALARASSLYEVAVNQPVTLGAFLKLTEAFAALPKGASPERSKIEAKQVALALDLARTSIDANEATKADDWFRTATSFEAAKSPDAKPQVDAVKAKLDDLLSGQHLVVEAVALMDKASAGPERFIRARELLKQAKGVKPEDLEKPLKRATDECMASARDLLAKADKLAESDPKQAIALIYRAKNFAADLLPDEISRLLGRSEVKLAENAQRLTAQIFDSDPRRALAVLDDALAAVKAPELTSLLKKERSARSKLLGNAALNEQVAFVPQLSSPSCSALYMTRREITNAEFRDFVAGGGYLPQSGFFDKAVDVSKFVDESGRPGPRSWSNGTFGDLKNASLPVRGITVHEARAFALWRSAKKGGGKWRLPKAQEWEVAAGWSPETGKVLAYPWGATFDSKKLVCATRDHLPLPVGQWNDDRSPLGLLDMAGNVSEWVDGGSAPVIKGASSSIDRMSASVFASVLQNQTPPADPPRSLIEYVGFRLVLEIPEEGP
jgi:tRNA A-37 threonylcarbamoyl transferase component Bud32